MPAAALIAFVAGVCLLQTQAVLPAAGVLAALAAAGAIALGLSLTGRGGRPLAALLAVAGCVALGFSWAGARSTERLADELAFADEGRDVRVEGTVASLPIALERGVRFEFDVERILTPEVKIPARVLLAWYASGLEVQPGEPWQLTVRLRRPHGALNPGGFDPRGVAARTQPARDRLCANRQRTAAGSVSGAFLACRLRDRAFARRTA